MELLGRLVRAASWEKMASLHPGELEHAIHPDRDWTKHWAWAITIRVHSIYDHPTSCDLRILVKDLPARLQDKEICWNGSHNMTGSIIRKKFPSRRAAIYASWHSPRQSL